MQLVITPDSGEEHLYWPLILEESDSAIICTHFYTIIINLKGKSIGEGAAFTGMRQLGGSLVLRSSPLLSLDSIRNIVNLVSS
jgi:DHA2 family multidrug resistance protein